MHVSVHCLQEKTVMSELIYALDTSFERGPQSLKVTPPPNIMPSVLTTRQWPVRQ